MYISLIWPTKFIRDGEMHDSRAAIRTRWTLPTIVASERRLDVGVSCADLFCNGESVYRGYESYFPSGYTVAGEVALAVKDETVVGPRYYKMLCEWGFKLRGMYPSKTPAPISLIDRKGLFWPTTYENHNVALESMLYYKGIVLQDASQHDWDTEGYIYVSVFKGGPPNVIFPYREDSTYGMTLAQLRALKRLARAYPATKDFVSMLLRRIERKAVKNG